MTHGSWSSQAPRTARTGRGAGLARIALATIALATIVLAACSADEERSSTVPSSTGPSSTVPSSTVPSSVAGEETADDEAIASTRAIFTDVADDDPGCTIAVGRDGEVVYAEAFGAAQLDPLEPMSPATVVDIGSTSKQFTANAVLLLAEREELELDDALAAHLPDLPAWAEETTLRQLMHHTSGIPDYIGLLLDEGFDFADSSTAADALDAVAAVTELDFEPGTAWEYSNSNYFLLGEVVLAVTGSPLGEFLAAEVFEPLGLDMVMDPVAEIPGKATSYEGIGADAEVADSAWEQTGDGGIQTTPSELVRWAAQYWSPTIGGDTIGIDRLDDAVTVTGDEGDLDGAGRYGAGIEVVDVPEIGQVLTHSGAWAGFVTSFVVVPEQQVAVAATCVSPDTLELLTVDDDLGLLRPWVA